MREVNYGLWSGQYIYYVIFLCLKVPFLVNNNLANNILCIDQFEVWLILQRTEISMVFINVL